MIVLLYAWGSLFGVPIEVMLQSLGFEAFSVRGLSSQKFLQVRNMNLERAEPVFLLFQAFGTGTIPCQLSGFRRKAFPEP